MKILFIGDFRPAQNYGSIATTETLQKLLFEVIDENCEVKYIDRRSYDRATPINGFIETHSLKDKIKQNIPSKYKNKYSKFKSIFKSPLTTLLRIDSLHIPYRLSLFEKFYTKIENCEILQFEKNLINWSDIVFINGEGTIVNGTDKFGIYNGGGRYTLFLAWLSKFKYNKPTCLVNHTVDPGNSDADEMIAYIYPELDFVSVREPLSLKKLNEIKVFNAKYIPDSLFSYIPITNWKPNEAILSQIDFSKPYICIGDSTGIRENAWQKSAKWDTYSVLTELICELKKIFPQIVFVDGFNGSHKIINEIIKKNKLGYVNLKNCNHNDLFYVLKSSELFISGRWHSSIISLLANTPILLWGSDSHKTKALYSIIDYSYPFFETNTLPIHIEDIILCSKDILSNKINVKNEIKNKIENISKQSYDNVLFIKEYLNNKKI